MFRIDYFRAMKFLRILLSPFGIIYWLITYFRNLCYDFGIFKSFKIPVKSIAVGNLSVGGTGKTPHIEYLVRLLKNKKLATLSRGYKRKTEGFILADKNATAEMLGDEPFQFYSKFKNQVAVAVDANRKNGVEQLQKLVNPEVILLDDAFQHRKVKAGFYVLLTDFSKLFSHDFILPLGDLRESALGKKRADVIIVTKCPPDISEIARQKIVKDLKVKIPVFFSTIRYDDYVYNEIEKLKLNEIGAKLIVAGIAKPKPFVDFVKKENDEVMLFPDHHHFSEEDIAKILAKAKERKIITTEKDYTRLKDKIDAKQLYYLPIQIEIVNNSASFDKIIKDYVG